MNNIEMVFEVFEVHREQFEKRMNAGLYGVAYGHLMACQALITAVAIFEPDAVEVEQMGAAEGAMSNWFFGKE